MLAVGVDTVPSQRFLGVTPASSKIHNTSLFLANYCYGAGIKSPLTSTAFPGTQVVTLSRDRLYLLGGVAPKHTAYVRTTQLLPWLHSSRTIQVPDLHFHTKERVMHPKRQTDMETLDFGPGDDNLFTTAEIPYVYFDAMDFGSDDGLFFLGPLIPGPKRNNANSDLPCTANVAGYSDGIEQGSGCGADSPEEKQCWGPP